MPDLNWENPEVKQAVFDMMRWWLEKGIDGFRMDVINLLVKPEGLKGAADPRDTSFYWNQPGIHELLHEMNREVTSRYDCFTVGELPNVTPSQAQQYVNADWQELDMLFQFEHFEAVDRDGWDLVVFKRIQRRWYEALREAGWNSQFLNNHDSRRMVSRFGNDRAYRVESAKLLAILTHTLPGTPYVYQGEEIGMTDVAFPTIEQYRDIQTVSRYREAVQAGADPAATLRSLAIVSRDNARTPFQWDGGPQAGFTTGEPWLPVNPNWRSINLAADLASPSSICRFYQQVIRLRKRSPALVYGEYRPYLEEDPHLYLYERAHEGVRLLVALNLSDQERPFPLPAGVGAGSVAQVLGNYPHAGEVGFLRPWEARVYQIRA